MNCCSDYGQCTQGHNCAAHIVPLAAATRTCDSMGICNMHPECTHLGECAAEIAAFNAIPNSPPAMDLGITAAEQDLELAADYWARALIGVGFFVLGLLGGLFVLPRL